MTDVQQGVQQNVQPPEYPALDDSALVALARKGDHTAFGEIYNRYVKKVYNYVYYRTMNHHDAEDLTSRVFQRAFNHMATFDDRGVPVLMWMYKIAHNLVANFHRDRSRRKVVPLEDFTGSLETDAPEYEVEALSERERLLAALHTLPEERQQLIILKFVDKLSNQEIGAIMDRSEGAIKSLYHRTLLSLREVLTRTEAPD